jgi:hypothetical protein
MKHNTTVRFTDEMRDRLKARADERGTNLSAIVSHACERYLADETIAAELQGVEARLGATVIRTLSETARVEDDVQLVIAQLDQLIRFVFQATPEIFDKESAGIIGARRYSGFLESFAEQFQSRKRRAVFATKVDELHPLDDE